MKFFCVCRVRVFSRKFGEVIVVGEVIVEWFFLFNRYYNYGYWSMSSVFKEDFKIFSICFVVVIFVGKKILVREVNGYEVLWVWFNFDGVRGENYDFFFFFRREY